MTQRASLPSDPTEEARAALLEAYNILDSDAEQVFDDLTDLASIICEAPTSLITLLDGDREWFKSARGTNMSEAPLKYSFCTHAVAEPEIVTVVEDALQDVRFNQGNPLVDAGPQIRSYAGAPLLAPGGVPLGTICVIDVKPRQYSARQRRALQALGRQVVTQLELRRRVGELERKQAVLQSLNEQLDQFAYIISHDLKAPLRHQSSFAKLMLEDFSEVLPGGAVEYIEQIIDAGTKAQIIITDLNDYLHTVQTAFGETHSVDLARMLLEIRKLSDPPPHITISTDNGGVNEVQSNTAALRHILLNLVANAIKFNDKEEGTIDVTARRKGEAVVLSVTDNGPGIHADDQERIFKLFGRGRSQGVTKVDGRGLGLAIASKLAENLGGSIGVSFSSSEGTRFEVVLPLN